MAAHLQADVGVEQDGVGLSFHIDVRLPEQRQRHNLTVHLKSTKENIIVVHGERNVSCCIIFNAPILSDKKFLYFCHKFQYVRKSINNHLPYVCQDLKLLSTGFHIVEL